MHACLAILFALTPAFPQHVIPDGVVYRGVQLLIQPDRIEVRYQLGLSEYTLRGELATRLGPYEGLPSDETEALNKYRGVMLPTIPGNLRLEIDGRPVVLRPLRSELIAQHHAQIECWYHVPFTVPSSPCRLVLRDDNFADVPGSHVLALKSRRDVDVLQSDAPALLVRAPLPPLESSDSTIPPPSSHRLEAFFCLAGPPALPAQATAMPSAKPLRPAETPTPSALTTASPRETNGTSQQPPLSTPRPRMMEFLAAVALVAILAGISALVRRRG
jgi:hypothetical protein